MAASTLGSGGRNDETEWKGLPAFSKEVGQQPLTLFTTYRQIFYETQRTPNGPQNLAVSLGSQLKGPLESHWSKIQFGQIWGTIQTLGPLTLKKGNNIVLHTIQEILTHLQTESLKDT